MNSPSPITLPTVYDAGYGWCGTNLLLIRLFAFFVVWLVVFVVVLVLAYLLQKLLRRSIGFIFVIFVSFFLTLLLSVAFNYLYIKPATLQVLPQIFACF